MGLEELDLVQSKDLLDDDGVRVGGACLLGLALSQLEDVFQAVQGNLGSIGICIYLRLKVEPLFLSFLLISENYFFAYYLP